VKILYINTHKPIKLDKTIPSLIWQTIHSHPPRFSMYSLLYACDDAGSHVYHMKTPTLSNDRIWSMFCICLDLGSGYNAITESQDNSKRKEGTRSV